MKDDRLHLVYIQECIARIERYTQEGRESFLVDTKTQDAVLRNLQTLAESTQRISEPLKQAHPEVEWRAIAAFRNVVVHGYLGVSLPRIWDIVAYDLNALKVSVNAMLGNEPS